jgi:hypothetical protein
MGKTGVLERHDRCAAHKLSVRSWKQFIANSRKDTTIDRRFDTSRKYPIETNRHYIRTVAEVLLKCCQQDMALREHREHDISLNRGNFREWLDVVANLDDVIKNKLCSASHNAIYTSPDIQNTLINIMGDIVRNSVCSAVQKIQMFSLLVDETRDISKIEQMSIVLRYVDNDTSMVNERFLTYNQAEELTAESLTSYILDCSSKQSMD